MCVLLRTSRPRSPKPGPPQTAICPSAEVPVHRGGSFPQTGEGDDTDPMEIRASFERSFPPRELTTLRKYAINTSVILPILQDEETRWKKENLLGTSSLHRSRHGRPGHRRPTQTPRTPQDRFPFEPRGPVCVSEKSWATTVLITGWTYDYAQTVVPIVHTGTLPLVPVSTRGR
jgi:hypothetical protein